MNDNIPFAWGDKGGLSKAKDHQFYKNFQYDGITYNLFDNVYLFKDDDFEPHLGKIVKIWAHVINDTKKVKIVWFLHPSEVHKHLGSYWPSEKEVFLACGENDSLPGLADINPLEAIAGKCRVICTSKDDKNPRPSQADVEKADFVFCKLFDVSRCTLSDELPAKIASLKIELFLNKKEDLISLVVPPAISNGAAGNMPASSSSSPIPVPLKPDSLEISGTEVKEKPRQEEKNSLKIRIPSIRKEDGRSESARTPVGTHKEVPRKRDADGKLKQQKGVEDQVEEVSTRAVDASDRSKWFDYSGKNWAQKIQIEDQEGRLVLLQNFDALLTASEIEDLIFRATSFPCTVRLVTNHMYGDRSYGMAYAFFKSKEAANQVVTKLTKAYLVLPDGRPLLCSKGALEIPKQSTSLMGHLAIDKLKKKMSGDEMKKAVSTAHCSQSNTIEFEMALEWIATQDRFANASRKLTEKHKKERERIPKK